MIKISLCLSPCLSLSLSLSLSTKKSGTYLLIKKTKDNENSIAICRKDK